LLPDTVFHITFGTIHLLVQFLRIASKICHHISGIAALPGVLSLDYNPSDSIPYGGTIFNEPKTSLILTGYSQDIPCSIDLACPQVTHQQLRTAEHAQGQKAVMATVAMEKTSFLMTMHRIVGGVEIEDQFFRYIDMIEL